MNILLAYSKTCFDPADPQVRMRAGASSAGTLAATLYEELSKLGEVDYVDGQRPPLSLPKGHYDLAVGILGSLSPLMRRCKIDRKVLFAVNMHPAERNRILRAFNRRWQVCSARHLSTSCAHLRTVDDIEAADDIILVGNETVAASYLHWGVEPERLHCLDYASILPLAQKGDLQAGAPPRILYLATEMCLRKGYDILHALLQQAHRAGSAFHVDIVGMARDRGYRARLAGLQAELGDKVAVHGWMDSSGAEYRSLLAANDWIVFPSMEEGQAGSVLDALSQGVVPLVTCETGIHYSPLGYLEPSLESARNAELLQRLLSCPADEVLRLRRSALEYYRRVHLPWRGKLAELLRAAAARNPDAERKPAPVHEPEPSMVERFITAPAALLLSGIMPSRQHRKQLYNHWRMVQLRLRGNL
ncbi:MAG: glycosyltransferase [Akkermansia sp.]|nr:glycosyltransferase [Akkermansia sp.]